MCFLKVKTEISPDLKNIEGCKGEKCVFLKNKNFRISLNHRAISVCRIRVVNRVSISNY